MRAHYFQHVPFEGLGSIESWLLSNGYEVSCSRLFEFAIFPNLEDIDFLIVMGGPMSVNDEHEYAWLAAEKAFIRKAIEIGKPVLGICLGAQLIANCLGAKVYPNEHKEIGWFPVQSVNSDSPSLFQFPETIDVFHWHGETFDLPPNAGRFAKSEACANQGFQIGATVIGLQFHLETTAESAREIIDNCRDELIPSQWIQSESALLSVKSKSYQHINKLMGEILEYLAH
jgi:GMP synthase-like glutamine amidotransferase